LVVLDDDVAPGLDWDGTSLANKSAEFAMDNLYSKLVEYKVTYDANGAAHMDLTGFRPDLAESFTQNALTWTFKLRQGVKSCAGNTMTADDVIYTFQRAMSVSGAGGPIAWFVFNVGNILPATPLKANATADDKSLHGEVTKIDQNTIQIKQSAPSALMLPGMELFAAGIVDATEMKKHVTASDPWAHLWADSGGAAGFAPYCLASWAKGSEIVFKRNPNWNVKPLPYYDTVTVRKVPNGSNRVSALKTGDAQVATNLTTKQLADVAQSSGLAAASFVGSRTLYLDMNWKTTPFQKIALRQAIAYALPYDDIIKNGYNGFATAAPGFVSSVFVGFKPNNPYHQDLAKAKELLATAGFPNGQGLSQFASSFQLSYPIERQDQLQPVATIIQSALVGLGIPVQLNPIPDAEFSRRIQVTRDLPFALDDTVDPFIPDAGYAIQVMYIPAALGGSTPSTNYDNKMVQHLWLEVAKSEGDPAKRLAEVQQAIDIAASEVGMLPVVEFQTAYAHTASVTGFLWDPDNALRFQYLRPSGATYNPDGDKT
jgi:peptide/nickel transport system substrate-binding protein